MGAAGRDFHNFNVFFRNNPRYKVVCFTAAQIPGIAGRIYPPQLAGPRYPKGIPIFPEEQLEELIEKWVVDEVVFSYSDVSFSQVMEAATRALSKGASFSLLGPRDTMLKAKVPVIAVTGVRTGVGKSSVSYAIARFLKEKDIDVVVVRHPMPYRDFYSVQTFTDERDLERYGCTMEEREDYMRYIKSKISLLSGVDYGAILKKAERHQIILWDGGNNDFPFYTPDLYITVADCLRAGDEATYFPGSVNFRAADVILLSKYEGGCAALLKSAKERKGARLFTLKSVITAEQDCSGFKRVVCVEDGPTLTHGGMRFGAAYLFAKKMGLEVVEPQRCAKGCLKEVVKKRSLLSFPALGYTPSQLRDLERSLRACKADAVLSSTPGRLEEIIKVNKPIIKVDYDFIPPKSFFKLLERFLRERL